MSFFIQIANFEYQNPAYDMESAGNSFGKNQHLLRVVLHGRSSSKPDDRKTIEQARRNLLKKLNNVRELIVVGKVRDIYFEDVGDKFISRLKSLKLHKYAGGRLNTPCGMFYSNRALKLEELVIDQTDTASMNMELCRNIKSFTFSGVVSDYSSPVSRKKLSFL